MIVAILGTPSPLTYVATHILRAMVQVVRGEHHVIGVNTVADLREAWPNKEGRMPAVVLASDMPDPELIAFLTQAKTPLFFSIEPLEIIANFMIGSRSLDPISALRVGARALSGLEGLSVHPPPSAIAFRASSLPLQRMIGNILRLCGDDGDPETVARVVAYLGYEDRADLAFGEFLAENRTNMFPTANAPPTYDQQMLDAIAVVARGYAPVAAGRALEELIWPGSCFLKADAPGVTVEEELELEGRARFLAHGPYFYLPPGLWEAEIAIEVSGSLSDNRVGFDVYSGGVIAACTVTLPDEGAFACDMVFRVSDLTTPVEIRIQLLSGAIEGRLKLNGVRLVRR